MATYTFNPVPAWGSVGQFARVGIKKSTTFPVTIPAGTPATVVQGGVTKVGYLESDADGLVPQFTTTDIPSVVVNFGIGLLTIHSLEAISAGAASAAAAAASATTATTQAGNASTSASNASASAASAAAAASGAVSGKVDKSTLMVNVKDSPYSAVGDGVNDDTAEINAAIVAGAGKTVFLPAGTYLIDATAGIKMWTANVRLLLDPAAKILAAPNNASGYSMVEVNAAGCVIQGGTIQGDGTGHTGGTGEQGHCITTAAGANGLIIRDVTVTKAWGDGICIQGNPADVSVINVTADDNRRQGMSITRSVRTRVLGGVYKNTGLSQNTSPSAGIDVEPNTTDQVVDCVISGVTFSANRGPGLQVAAATGGLSEVTVTGCTSVDSTTWSGFYIIGPTDTIKAKVSGCTSVGNALNGFVVLANKVELTSCTARSNTQTGFLIQESDCTLTDPVAVENGRHGITNSSTSILRMRLIGGVTRANSQTTTGTYINVDLQGPATVIGHMSDAGQLTNKPAWGFVIRTGVTARLIGCDVEGTFATASLLDQPGNTYMMPRPGTTDPGWTGVATTTTAPAAGGAGALPATPLGYLTMNVNGTARKVAFYA